MKLTTYLTLSLIVFLTASCGKGRKSIPQGQTKIETKEPLKNDSGIYRGLLKPLNNSVAGDIKGSATLTHIEEEFTATIRFTRGPKNVLHHQNLHNGERCPGAHDDLNQDGFIDAEEAFKVIKDIIIPLDDDLSSQWLGLGTFPVSDDYGGYIWSRSTPIESLLTDLKEEDINLSDNMLKLSQNSVLKLSKKVVMISGVSESSELPETVSSRGRLLKHQSLPIACAVLRLTTGAPGVIDRDNPQRENPHGEIPGGTFGNEDGVILSPPENGPVEDYGSTDDLLLFK